MKRFALPAIFVLATIFLMNACASDKETSTDPGFRSTAAVPGEKTGGEGVGATAGPGGAGANVKW